MGDPKRGVGRKDGEAPDREGPYRTSRGRSGACSRSSDRRSPETSPVTRGLSRLRGSPHREEPSAPRKAQGRSGPARGVLRGRAGAGSGATDAGGGPEATCVDRCTTGEGGHDGPAYPTGPAQNPCGANGSIPSASKPLGGTSGRWARVGRAFRVRADRVGPLRFRPRSLGGERALLLRLDRLRGVSRRIGGVVGGPSRRG